MNAPRMLRPLLAAMLILLGSSLGHAAPPLAPADAKTAARERFERGVAAYEEKRFGDAAEEFDAAYRISGAFKILFNIGQVNVALGRPVEAVDAYDKYLKQGGATIAAERRKEVQIELEHQLARIGSLAVRAIPDGADVRIDGLLIGKSPLRRAVRLPVGRHTVEAMLAGHTPQLREVDIAGRAEVEIEFTLVAPAVSHTREATTPPAPQPAPPPIPVMIVGPRPEASPSFGEQTGGRSPATTAETAARVSAPVNWQRIIGAAVTIAGLTVATVGGVIAYKGTNDTNDARDRLGATDITGEEYDLIKPDYDEARRRTQVGWVTAGVGAAGVVAGIVLIATAPERTVMGGLRPWTDKQMAGLAWGGAW